MLLTRARQLWGPWWFLPGGLPLTYVALVTLRGDLRVDHLALLCIVFGLAYTTARARRFFLVLLPYLLVAVGYDALRYPRVWLLNPDRILGCGLRAAELVFFSVGPNQTVQDWFSVHNSLGLDLFCAVPYFAFVYVVLGYALYLYFVDRPRMLRFLWAYAIGNAIAFVVWLSLPAAPPWYLRAHGCVIDLAATANPGALQRVDQWLGIPYFSVFYGRAATIFGAIPSMHCAYPLIGMLVSWRHAGWRTRPIHLGYTLLMAFAAVYLDHHWILDVLAGWLVAMISVALSTRAVESWSKTPVRVHLDKQPLRADNTRKDLA